MKNMVVFVKSLLFLIMLCCTLFWVGCYIPIKPLIDKNYNSYKQMDDVSNIGDVKIFRYISVDAIPSLINETTELIGDASWQNSASPDNQDIIDLKEYAKRVGADVVIFVYSGDTKYVGSRTTYYKQTNSIVSTPSYSHTGFWYIAFRRTIDNNNIGK